MRVLTYTDGTLTVIKEDNFYSKEAEKPSFITGSNFYYEPTLKQMDGKNLSTAMQNIALQYIESFNFPTMVKCVNAKGEYLGIKYVEKGEYEVLVAPPTGDNLFYIYDFISNSWKSAVVVDAEGFFKYVGYCYDVSYTYAFSETLVSEYPFEIQKYDFETKRFSLYIPYFKNYLLALEEDLLINTLNEATGKLAFGEQVSWAIQENEAISYLTNKDSSTPFIDTLLLNRNLAGETKDILVNKIIAKSNNFKLIYATLLGKFHSKQKVLENALTLEELKVIEVSN